MSNLPFQPRALSVLIVDDHDPIRKAIKRVLVSMGFLDFTECFDGADAIKIIEQKPIDLVICDLYMRNVMGFEVIAHVRRRNIGSDAPFIVVTGEASRDEIVKVADYGADDYILKPFQAVDLEKKVTQVLTKYYSPTPILRTLRQAERHYLSRDFGQANKTFDEALKIDPASMRAIYGKAITLSAMGQDADALELLNTTVQTNQSYYKNYAAIADISLKMGKSKQAIRAMAQELEINPKQANRQIQLAKMLMREGDAMGAIDHYREALRESPNIKSALMGMGQAFARLENLEKAFYYFKRVRRYHPSATKALDLAVKTALASGDEKKAELFLRDEKKLRPDRTDTYIVLSKLYAHMNKYEDAIAVLAELLHRDPENVAAMKMKGVLFMRMQDYKKAMQLFKELTTIAPDVEVYQHLGDSLMALGQMEAALDALHQSLALDSQNSASYMRLADVHEKSKQYIKAYLCLRRAAQCGADRKRCAEDARITKARIHARRFPRRAS